MAVCLRSMTTAGFVGEVEDSKVLWGHGPGGGMLRARVKDSGELWAGVEDRGVLKEGRWQQPCPRRSRRRDGDRWVFRKTAKCGERACRA
jgi:hypothetical protein